MSKTVPQIDHYKDALELMFFAYRDFIADPDKILAAHGFGRAHHRVLHFVGCNPGLSIAELLDILDVSKQSLARVLKDLIEQDYIAQNIGRHDRRKRLLQLTAKGHALHDKLITPQLDRFADVLQETGAEQFQIWKQVMRHIINPQTRPQVDALIENARREPQIGKTIKERAHG